MSPLFLHISHHLHQELFQCNDWKPIYQGLDQWLNHGQPSPPPPGGVIWKYVVGIFSCYSDCGTLSFGC